MLRTLAARFFQTLAQLTWLPVPAFAREGYAPCVGAVPLVGGLHALLAVLVYILALLVLPASLAVLLALVSVWLVTGLTAEVSLAQQGPRGVVSVVLLLLVKLLALLELQEETVPMALLVALPFSQLAGVAALFALTWRLVPAQPAPEHSRRGRVVAVAFGIAPLFILTPGELVAVLAVVIPTLALTIGLLRRRRVSAVTGLHIAALVAEVAVFVALNVAWETAVEPVVL